MPSVLFTLHEQRLGRSFDVLARLENHALLSRVQQTGPCKKAARAPGVEESQIKFYNVQCFRPFLHDTALEYSNFQS